MRISLGVGLSSLVALASLIAGCGEDSGSSKEAFAQEANAICVKANEKAGAALHLAGEKFKGVVQDEPEGVNQEIKIFFPILIKDAEEQLKGMVSLEKPSDDAKQIEEIEAAYEAWLKEAKTTPIKPILRNDIFNKARELSGKSGLSMCDDQPYEERYIVQK